MKVLILSTHYLPNIGGVETHLYDLTKALVRRNIDVFVLAYQPLTAKAKWKIYERGSRYKIFRIPWFVGLFYKLVHMPLLEFLYLLPGLFIVLPLVIIFQNPDVIHTHGIVAGFVGVFWGKIFGKRIITTTHSIYNFPQTGFYRNFAKWIFGASDMVLTLSKQSKREIEGLGIPKEKIKVFTYWVDLNLFKKVENAKKKLDLEGKFVVFCASRLVPEKGIRELLKAASMWNKNIKLLVASDGPLKKEVVNYQKKNENIVYVGRLAQEQLPLYYSVANLFIIPSTHEEGFGRVILESLACGTPIIGSERGAVPEAMDDTVGRLIYITPENIKNAVEYFYKNPAKLDKLSKNCRKFALKKYSEKNAETIISSYKRKS